MNPRFKQKALYAAISGTLLSASVLPSLAQAVPTPTYSIDGVLFYGSPFSNTDFIPDVRVLGEIESLLNTGYIDGLSIEEGASISNGGIVSRNYSLIFNLTNSGLIQGTNGIKLSSSSHIDGGITNSGTIKGDYAGILLSSSNIDGGISNNGTIAGGSYGIELSSTSNISGGITNNGTIAGGSDGISIGTSSGISGGITNSGTIAGLDGVYGRGIYVGGSGISGNITNSGTISGTADIEAAGILIDQSSVTGAITNDSGGIISGTANTSGTGIKISRSSELSFAITNSGTISGSHHSIYVSDDSLINGINNQAGGLLQGNLYIGDDSATVTNAGTIWLPSTARGADKAQIKGNYTQSATGVLRIGAVSKTEYGQLVVGGTATLESNAKFDVDVNSLNTLAVGETLASVLSAGTLVSDGTYSVTDNSALFNFSGSKNGNAVDLKVNRSGVNVVDAVAGSGLRAGAGAGAVFDDLISNGGGTTGMDAVITRLGQLETGRQVAEAVESTLPAATGGVAQISNFTNNAVTNLVSSRQDMTRGLSSGDGFMVDRHVWLKPFGSWTDQGDRQGVTGYDIDSYGLALGVDGDISSTWNLGFAFAYINSDVQSTLAAGQQSVDIDSYQAKAYATAMLDNVTALNLQAGVGRSNYDSSRLIFTGDVAEADYDSWNMLLRAELERSYQMNDRTVLTPYVHADYSYVDVDSYMETGAGALNLDVQDDSADSMVIGAGIKANYSASKRLLLLADAGIGYDLMADRSSLTSSFAGSGAQFTTQGMKPDEVVYNAGLGAAFNLDNGSEVTLRYDIDGREDYTDETVSVNFRMLF